MITRNNYELYIIDFYDGKLNKVQVEELHVFLNENPDLKAEFELFSNTAIEAEPIIFADKNSLKKEDTSRTERLIAYFENDLSGAEKIKLEQQLKVDSALAQELDIVKKTRVLPDYTILFANKSALKREAKVISFSTSLYRNLSIAASIILIAIAYFIFRPDRKDEKMIADDKNNSEVPVKAPHNDNSTTPAPIADIKPSTNNHENDNSQKNDENKTNERKLENNKVKQSPSVSPSFAEQKNIRKEEAPVKSPIQQNVQQNNLPEEKLANDPKIVSPNLNPTQSLQANNPVNPSNPKNPGHKLGQVNDLSEVFTTEELAELGIANIDTKKSEPGNILDFAAEKLKHFSDSKDIAVAKDANTFAVNVGKKFSVSHTSGK